MPTAYTPGLRITEDTIVQRERRLPIKGEVLVKVGDKTEPDTVVARAMLEGNLYSFKAAEQLGVSAGELIGALKKQVGDTITKDEVFAEIKGLFGLFRNECKAPVSGTIEHISPTSGYIGIREPARPIDTTAYLHGEVVDVLPGEGAVIQSRAAFIQGIFGVGSERSGVLRVVGQGPHTPLTPDLLAADLKGAVVVCGSGASTPALQKAAEVGITGLVLGALPDQELRQYVGYDIGVAITGQEKVPFTLVLTEGFGVIPMADRTFTLLRSLDGKVASLNGATQIRAGVIRPELIVPLGAEALGSSTDIDVAESALAPGVRVRVIREPYFGKLAEVLDLPPELHVIQTGAKVRVARVRIDGGEEAIVPRANLELILASRIGGTA